MRKKFAVRLIRIAGASERLLPVNEWIARLRTKEWVKKVQLQHYTFDNEDNRGRFTVLIEY